MTENKRESHGLKSAIALVLFACVAAGLFFGISKLREIWIAQCIVTDVDSQIKVVSTRHVTDAIVREWFSLTNGSNLALIDYAEMRKRILKEHPIVSSMTITRHLPDKLLVTIEERKPVARVNYTAIKTKNASGKEFSIPKWDVVDSAGVVFSSSKRDTQSLPVIVGKGNPVERGERLRGKHLCALRLIELCLDDSSGFLSMPEVSIANDTYLTVTLKDYSVLKIDWRIIDDPESPTQPVLETILSNLVKKLKTGLYPGRGTYTVTEPNRISYLPYERERIR